MNTHSTRRSWIRPTRLVALSAIGALSLTACGDSSGPEGAADETFELTYTTYSSDTSDQSKTVQRWAEEVEDLTDGGVTVEFHYSQSLVEADQALSATRDGRADMAQAASLYTASDLPMYSVSELPFETNNPEAQLLALHRLFEENDAYRTNFEQHGVKQIFPLPIGIATLGLNEPADAPTDLDGRSIRSGGVVSEAMQLVGVNPVAMGANDVYESLERGVIDGYTSLGLSNLSTFGLSESTPYIVEPGIGSYASSVVVINSDVLESMPEEYQEAITTASENALSNGLEEMDAAGSEACEELRASGTEFSSFSDEEVSDWKGQSSIASDWAAETGEGADSVLNDYRRFIEEVTAESGYADPLTACMEE